MGKLVSPIAEWLGSLGMSEYAHRFAENDVDETVLRDLTDQDLKDLGVSLGHRRKMLRAIADAQAAATTVGKPETEPPRQDQAERRQVTVMFCDLVGSTALSASMDPEDLREIIAAYQKSVAESVCHFDGFVAKYMGDGVLIYFGYPKAHEDDAERAVRVSLSIISSVGRLQTRAPEPLAVRIGIATGLVVIGNLLGSGEAQERGIVGEAPNLAARLQALADPNAVVIAESTRRLIGDLFEYRAVFTSFAPRFGVGSVMMTIRSPSRSRQRMSMPSGTSGWIGSRSALSNASCEMPSASMRVCAWRLTATFPSSGTLR
jgi:class 3 adenylate cyclase